MRCAILVSRLEIEYYNDVLIYNLIRVAAYMRFQMTSLLKTPLLHRPHRLLSGIPILSTLNINIQTLRADL